MKVAERFWAKVNKHGPMCERLGTRCWEWTAGIVTGGYGGFWFDGTSVRAPKMAWFLTYGVWPVLQMLHKCDNPPCVRPSHLFDGSHQDNVDDRQRKGRSAIGDRNASRKYPERRPRGRTHYSYLHPEKVLRGELHGRAKLTFAAAKYIRYLSSFGFTQVVIAERLDVSQVTVSKVIQGKLW